MLKRSNMSKFIYESFGETILFAESLGWKDTVEQWSPEIADEMEQDALEYIRSQNYKIIEEK